MSVARRSAQPPSPTRASGGPRRTSLLYLFCVLEPGTEAHRLLQEGAVPGMDEGSPAYPVEASGLVAAVASVPAEHFAEEPLNALLSDLQRVAPMAVRHDQAVRRLVESAPAVVPLAFGAVYQGREPVETLLRARSSEFQRLLEDLRDRREWGLKIFAEPPMLRQAVEADDAQLRRMAEEIAATGPGRAYLLGKRRENAVGAAVQHRAAQLVQAITSDLAQLSAAARLEQPLGAATEGVWLVGKAAFLVDSAKLPQLQARAAALGQAHAAQGVRLELSGPWAPYSFIPREPAHSSAGQ